MKPGHKYCEICHRNEALGDLCKECCRSYDRALAKDSTTLSGLIWAARRARRFALQKYEAVPPPVSIHDLIQNSHGQAVSIVRPKGATEK